MKFCKEMSNNKVINPNIISKTDRSFACTSVGIVHMSNGYFRQQYALVNSRYELTFDGYVFPPDSWELDVFPMADQTIITGSFYNAVDMNHLPFSLVFEFCGEQPGIPIGTRIKIAGVTTTKNVFPTISTETNPKTVPRIPVKPEHCSFFYVLRTDVPGSRFVMTLVVSHPKDIPVETQTELAKPEKTETVQTPTVTNPYVSTREKRMVFAQIIDRHRHRQLKSNHQNQPRKQQHHHNNNLNERTFLLTIKKHRPWLRNQKHK